MKVLFAVSNENISEAIIKKYQDNFKEVISYKNVYYFNAVVKELQNDNSYDRIVISEDLEVFSNNAMSIDKFLFGKMDKISDEAQKTTGEVIPIIYIANESRNKSDDILNKYFSIGIYNVLLGNDRTITKICNLIQKPRVKKEAKAYYQISGDDADYVPESINEIVSQTEVNNILKYYRNIQGSPDKFSETFDRISTQYNDIQLKYILEKLPVIITEVLEQKNLRYREIMNKDRAGTSIVVEQNNLKQEVQNNQNSENRLELDFRNQANTQLNNPKNINLKNEPHEQDLNFRQREKEIQNQQQIIIPRVNQSQTVKNVQSVDENNIQRNDLNTNNTKNLNNSNNVNNVNNEKNILADVIEKQGLNQNQSQLQPSFDQPQIKQDLKDERKEQNITTQVPLENITRNINQNVNQNINQNQNINENQNQKVEFNLGLDGEFNIDNILPNEVIEEAKRDEKVEINQNKQAKENIEKTRISSTGELNFDFNDLKNVSQKSNIVTPSIKSESEQSFEFEQEKLKNVLNTNTNKKKKTEFKHPDLTKYISKDKKIAAFVGTSKNGTSFIVNSLGMLFSSIGIKTAILDMTQNKNSYYIATKNDEELRKKAKDSINKLKKGLVDGIRVSRNLDVYTSIPDDMQDHSDGESILRTLIQNYSLVLIDTDFETNFSYFAGAEEIYLIQSLDILTMQPLTNFLKDLKTFKLINDDKVKVVINKDMALKGISKKVIVGGISTYNHPSMSYMKELFDRNKVKVCSIPFDQTVYQKYLENIIYCKYDISGYPKKFIESLKILGSLVYPLISRQSSADISNRMANTNTRPMPRDPNVNQNRNMQNRIQLDRNNNSNFQRNNMNGNQNVNRNQNQNQNQNLNTNMTPNQRNIRTNANNQMNQAFGANNQNMNYNQNQSQNRNMNSNMNLNNNNNQNMNSNMNQNINRNVNQQQLNNQNFGMQNQMNQNMQQNQMNNNQNRQRQFNQQPLQQQNMDQNQVNKNNNSENDNNLFSGDVNDSLNKMRNKLN